MHKLGTHGIDQISLSFFEDKRYVLDDEIHRLACFHKDSVTSCKEIQKVCDKKKRLKKDYDEKDCDKKIMIKKILIKKKRLKKIAKNLHPSDKMILVVMWMRLLGKFETSSLFFYEKISSEQKAPNHKSIKA